MQLTIASSSCVYLVVFFISGAHCIAARAHPRHSIETASRDRLNQQAPECRGHTPYVRFRPCLARLIACVAVYNDLAHPPPTYISNQYAWRTADGSYNNVSVPDMGKAHTPYSRSVQQEHPLPKNMMPDASLVFDTLLKREKVCQIFFLPDIGVDVAAAVRQTSRRLVQPDVLLRSACYSHVSICHCPTTSLLTVHMDAAASARPTPTGLSTRHRHMSISHRCTAMIRRRRTWCACATAGVCCTRTRSPRTGCCCCRPPCACCLCSSAATTT